MKKKIEIDLDLDVVMEELKNWIMQEKSLNVVNHLAYQITMDDAGFTL